MLKRSSLSFNQVYNHDYRLMLGDLTNNGYMDAVDGLNDLSSYYYIPSKYLVPQWNLTPNGWRLFVTAQVTKLAGYCNAHRIGFNTSKITNMIRHLPASIQVSIY